MKHNLLMPAAMAVLIAAGANSASAGAMFDFIPRLDFKTQNELVTKDISQSVEKCSRLMSNQGTCSAVKASNAPKLPQKPKN